MPAVNDTPAGLASQSVSFEDEEQHPAVWDPHEMSRALILRTLVEPSSRKTIPGYSGFTPGKASEAIVGRGYSQTIAQAQKLSSAHHSAPPAASPDPIVPQPAELLATAGIPSLLNKPQILHSGSKRSLSSMLKVTDLRYSTGYGEGKGLPAERTMIVDHDVPDRPEDDWAPLGRAIPGYSGYVPVDLKPREPAEGRGPVIPQSLNFPAGKVSGSDHTSFRVPSAPVTNQVNVLGGGVPGYSGFIPGKFAENVIGKTYTKANKLAMEKRGYIGGL